MLFRYSTCLHMYLWWSEISNNVGDPQTHTAPDCRLTEGVPRYRVVSYLGSHLVYPSAWLVLLVCKRRRLDLTWSLYRPGLGGPRVDMLHSGPGLLGSIDLTRAMHLVLCTPLVANGFLVIRPLCVPLREPLPLAGLTWWCFDTHLTPQAN